MQYKRLLTSLLPKIYRPPVFQGRKNPDHYFEGWYFKFIDQSGSNVWSLIPGVSYGDDTHCFIQVIHANSGRSFYLRYPIEEFVFSRNQFRIRVGPNLFSGQGFRVEVETGGLTIKGAVNFINPIPFPVKVFSPGIMGWYAFVPMMECYHGVVSMHHGLQGSLKINGSTVNFQGGKGYIEKDWGRSMPSDWIWIQSNHFRSSENVSFMLSLARIPWMKGHFPGFLGFLLIGGTLFRFATYNRSSVESLVVNPSEVVVKLRNRQYILEVKALRRDGGVLKAPRHGNMDREIRESIISTVEVRLEDLKGHPIFSDTGRFAGLEIVGDMEQYF